MTTAMETAFGKAQGTIPTERMSGEDARKAIKNDNSVTLVRSLPTPNHKTSSAGDTVKIVDANRFDGRVTVSIEGYPIDLVVEREDLLASI